jgi:molybdopterin synthase catalytic subunit
MSDAHAAPLFTIEATPIDVSGSEASLRQDSAGALVTFIGWVRDHTEADGRVRGVQTLEYQVYAQLATSEGVRVLQEAHAAFEIDSARCVHRSGTLQIGDVAVWVGVAAGHRDAAFRACRYIIDEIKMRLPIWKRETYAEGDSGWVNCQVPEHAGHPSSQELPNAT